MLQDYEILEDSVRNTFGSVVWSHKIQEKQADIYSNQYRLMETAKITAASLTSVGIVSLIFTDHMWLKLISALVSFVSVFISAFFKSFDLQTMVLSNKSTAQKLLTVREELKLLLLQIHLQQGTVYELTEQYRVLVKTIDAIYVDAPRTTDKAVSQARLALNITQDNTFTDEEININLPESLRRRDA